MNNYEKLRLRLKKEIEVCVQFEVPAFTQFGPKEAISFLFSPAFLTGSQAFRNKTIAHIYPVLFRYFPVVKIKYPQHLIEAQLVLTTKEQFCKALGVQPL